LKNRTLVCLMAMYFCFQWGNYFFVAWLPVYLQEGRHFSEDGMKPVLSTLFVAGICGMLSGGFAGDWLLKRIGLKSSRRLMGMSALGVSGIFIIVSVYTRGKGMAALWLIVAYLIFNFGIMVSYAVCIDIGGNKSGSITGAMNFSGQMGAFFLAILFGKMADISHSFNTPLLVLGFVLFAGCLLWLGIDPTKKLSSAGSP
jgi:ACS family glucarate transporter-like MFS transporter